MDSQVGIVHHGVGNTVSIMNLLRKIGARAVIIESSLQLSQHNTSNLKLIVPGVGSFDAGMRSLEVRKLDQAIRRFAQGGGSVLGICLGMHMLFESSSEGQLEGLGVMEGSVSRIVPNSEFQVPNVGWRKVIQVEDSRLLASVDRLVFYHNHSFALPSPHPFEVGRIELNQDYSVVVEKENVFGVQFHPEKSHSSGEKLLRNFINL